MRQRDPSASFAGSQYKSRLFIGTAESTYICYSRRQWPVAVGAAPGMLLFAIVQPQFEELEADLRVGVPVDRLSGKEAK